MKKLFSLISVVISTTLSMAQIADVTVYADCNKNGYSMKITEVLRTSGRASCGYVQLWAGGPKWATFNVGATITDYANLTEGTDPTYKNVAYYNTANVGGLYAWNNPYLNARATTWTIGVSTGISDVATTLWGSNWETPTIEQLDTLKDSSYGKTTWTWCDGSTTQYVLGCTLKGYKISGIGDYEKNSIFLPAAGVFDIAYRWVAGASVHGHYYSRITGGEYVDYLFFTEGDRRLGAYYCWSGYSVRAVLAQQAVESSENVTLTLYANGCEEANVITCPIGQQLRINAADYGYHFTQWTDGNTDNPRIVTMKSNATYTAQFAKNLYTITTVANDSVRGITKGDTAAQYLDTISIFATANYHYHFTQWDDGNTDNPRQVQVRGDKTYTALFDNNTYCITKIANNGSISGPSMSSYLDTISISVTANYGYHFTQWSDGNTDNPRSFVITKDTTFEALFAKNLYTITTTANESARGGTEGDTTVKYLEFISIYAIPNYGYHFAQWDDGKTNNPRQVQVTSDKTYTAQFAKNTYSITKIANGKLGQVSGNSSASYLDVVTLSATAIYGYHFSQWSDGNTENPRSFVITKDTTFEALFAKNIYSITTAVNDPARGVVQGDTTAEYLETATISATANYGYHFARWNDGNTNNPRQIQVTSDQTYTAQFDKNQYSVSTTKGANITSIQGSGKYYYLDEIVLSATANSNYQFDHWSDGNTDNPRTLIVTQDTSLTAYSSKIRSGKCGNNLTWVYADGILVVSDTGAMYDYTQSTMPWIMFKDSITNVVINNGCTLIGNNAFYGLQNRAFTSLVLPQSVETIGAYAFANCNRLTSISLPASLMEISNYAFSGCNSVDNITSLATTRPDIYENTFKDVSSYAYLYVPCDYKRSYQLNAYWNRFDLKCIGAEETTITNDDVTVNPNENDAAFTWPTNTQAASYSLKITKDGVVFCTLTFNSLGQLTGLAFAPGRGAAMETTEQAAIQSGNGFTFTVTGLNSASVYAFNMEVKDSGNQTIKSYTGTFQTKGTIITDLDNQIIDSPVNRFTKIIKDGHLLIQCEGKMYNAQGGEL